MQETKSHSLVDAVLCLRCLLNQREVKVSNEGQKEGGKRSVVEIMFRITTSITVGKLTSPGLKGFLHINRLTNEKNLPQNETELQVQPTTKLQNLRLGINLFN